MSFSMWLALAGFPLAIVGCQNENRSDAPGAAVEGANSPPSRAKLDDTTKTNILLRQIHAANQEEIDVGKIAEDKGQSADIRKFATEMVNDHTSADQKLTDLAKKSNLDLNVTPHDPVEQAMMAASDEFKRSLRGMSGAQFDVAYVAPQVEKHELVLNVIDLAEKTASGDTKKLLEETKPTVEMHLDHAKTLQRGLSFAAAAVGGGPGSEKGEMAPMGGKDGGKRLKTNP